MAAENDQDLVTLGDVANRLRDATRGGHKASVGDLMDALGPRSFVPLLLAPALLAATPLSGIPGLSAVCGMLIALISVEMLMSFDKAYIPDRIRRRSVDADALKAALEKAQPVIDWVDRHTRRRLSGLFHRPMAYVPKVLCLLSGLAMPFLEFIPFSASVVAIGVTFLALSILTRDGLFFLLALVPYAAIILFGLRLV